MGTVGRACALPGPTLATPPRPPHSFCREPGNETNNNILYTGKTTITCLIPFSLLTKTFFSSISLMLETWNLNVWGYKTEEVPKTGLSSSQS